ncbi:MULTISPECIES: dihydropyrimidinase [unclassified Rhizobium]|uniref:dihydropyrimidinase n=1 Tax=unclassified Rhizobium TaxID=2613769 RepID=UPI001ADADFE9|nr:MULTISPECIES: dihydropyrimidinase [unclassified Rhizobium]MBO9101500.1 dihydropyrimidinase [Rhizobium sp. L58/93]MBO9187493.1 dihydropyrimidinase [Rhizobium sp. E27B/91]QXZ86718.1 dihydropyrimidinase [Rhizobium sp. K1/93]QXZ93249.1 dihydropyrimidinase [Rhizobium sp. K15/93]
MRFDTIIRNGTVVTDSETFECDVGIIDGRIAAIETGLADAAEIIDATGLYVMPGGIDSHVHLAQPSGDGIVMADDFASGTLSAAFGGNTTVLPFCMQEKGTSLREGLKVYHAKADGECYVDVAFHLVVTDPTAAVLGQELPALVNDGYTSIKVFMTYESLRLRDDQILDTLDAARRSGAVVMVHCENEDAIQFLIGKHEAQGELAPKYHASSRPIAAEREATHRALSLAEIVETAIVIVHVSNRQAMEEIQRARSRGVNVAGETCPQYLMLTADDLDAAELEGAKFVCSPPPRDAESQIACWEGLQNGTFELFSSDHCPFRYDDDQGKLNEKGKRNFRWIPNGIPGVETRLPILFSEGVGKGRIDLNRFVALSSTNHAKQYGLYPQKGTIAIGSDADIALWDPLRSVTITNDILHHGADYTPYEGLEVTGWPVRVILRGKTIVNGDSLKGTKQMGRYLQRPGGVSAERA